jgi:hypothetical protein
MTRLRRVLRGLAWLAAGMSVLFLFLGWKAGLVGIPHIAGYYSPIFTPDGTSVFVISRDARAIVTGFGWETFTPPATVRYLRDRYALLKVGVSDRSVVAIETFPPSPLERTRVESYHNALFGMPAAHLRWADPSHLDVEIGVTIHAVPASHTFVVRTLWDKGKEYEHVRDWREVPTRIGGGYEPQHLHGDLEVIAVPGREAVPCAVVLLHSGDANGRVLLETSDCRASHPAGYSSVELQALSHRTEIERAERIRTTHDALIDANRKAGMTEIDAALAAIDEMERLGLYPRSTKLSAAPAACRDATRLFTISDEELRVGLFNDIEKAIATPGKRVSYWGNYLTYPGYTTSKDLNDFLATRPDEYFVKVQGSCWRMTIDR